VIIWAATKRPMILALRLLDRQIINAGKPKSHQPIIIKLPILVPIGAKPISRIIAPFVREAHGDAILMERPELFD